MKVGIYKNPMGSIDIYLYREQFGRLFIVKPMPLLFEEIIDGGLKTEPSLTIPYSDREFLQNLANSLDELKVKPENQSKTEGLLEATKIHLEDMRRLVFESEHVMHAYKEQK